jgi:hypothetical protein
VVSLSGFAVPMLALAIALRLLAWRAPGGPDRARQTVSTAGLMIAMIGLTLGCEWVSVLAVTPASPRRAGISMQVGGLVVTSVLLVAATAFLVRCRGQRAPSGRWRHDVLGDVVFLCGRVPLLRRWARPRAAAWVRRHAMTVFVVLSVLAAAAITGAQAVGEHVTDPLLIGWTLIAETAASLAFCLIGNAVAGFIGRAPRTGRYRIAEMSAVAGCLALLVAIAFHDALWSALGTGPLTSAGLAAVTLGAGLAASAVTAAALAGWKDR